MLLPLADVMSGWLAWHFCYNTQKPLKSFIITTAIYACYRPLMQVFFLSLLFVTKQKLSEIVFRQSAAGACLPV